VRQAIPVTFRTARKKTMRIRCSGDTRRRFGIAHSIRPGKRPARLCANTRPHASHPAAAPLEFPQAPSIQPAAMIQAHSPPTIKSHDPPPVKALFPSTIKAHFDGFAGYNAWANARLYDAAAQLSHGDYRRDGGAFFKSVQGTLNHLLVTDRVWLSRCAGMSAIQGPLPTTLDAILHEDLGELRAARYREDAAITAYVHGLDETAYGGLISYRRVSTPEAQTQPLVQALAHWFNHQTHHRGQAHALVTRFGGGPGPELDLLFYQRLVAAGKAV
jgi:uncharacterized damage-inducible protein DinB